MSAIIFHSRDGDKVEVSGSERAYIGIIVDAMNWSILSPYKMDTEKRPSPLRKLFSKEHYVNTSSSRFEDVVELAIGSMNPFGNELDGIPFDMFEIALNTTIVMGSDPVRLLAKLHGQCELHAYVLTDHQYWMADLIIDGRESGLYRDDCGWQSVVEFLLANKGPIVTSYSVCDSFPYMPYDEEDEDKWYEMSNEQQWDIAFGMLRQEQTLEICPQRLHSLFGEKRTAFDLIKAITK